MARKSIKKTNSSRDMKSPAQTDANGNKVVYTQTPLHALDDVPEPSTSSSINRHAVSAADILSQSLNNLDKSSQHNAEGGGAGHRSASFLLQGSASNLLKGGAPGSGNGTAAVPLRRRSQSDSSNQLLSTSTHSHTASSRSGRGERADSAVRSSIQKRSIYAPKELDDSGLTQEGLADALKVYDASGDDKSDSSADSYDANNNAVSGIGHDEEKGKRKDVMKRQISSLSQGLKQGSVADMSQVSDFDDDDDDGNGSLSSQDEYGFCGIRALHFRRCINMNRIATAVVRLAPCFWCFPIPVSATDRTVLTRLNIISAFFATGQMTAAAWLIIVLLIPENHAEQSPDQNLTHGMAPNLWSLTGSMYSIGFFGTFRGLFSR